MNARNVLLWLHIVAAMVTMGPLIMFDVAGPIAIRSGNTTAVRFLESIAKALGPMTMLIPVLGLALVAEGGYEIGDRWIIAALVIYAVMVANGIGVLGKAIGRAADRLDAGEQPTAELSRLYLFGAVNIGLFLVILWLMVTKPGM
ncbi:MAG TPA: DUF2269 family protein [Mycobacteriales bacterium]|nr:DUF2269 family protein [Mycobacteriales bacterium]